MTGPSVATTLSGETFDLFKGEELGEGGLFDLSKAIDEGMSEAAVLIGWGGPFDADVSCLCCIDGGPQGDVVKTMCYYNNRELFGGAMRHSKDVTSGDDDAETPFGDKEFFTVRFDGLPAPISSLPVAVSVHTKLNEKRKVFGMLRHPYIRIVDSTGLTEDQVKEGQGKQLAYMKLDVEQGTAAAVVVGRFVRLAKGFGFQGLTQAHDNLEAVIKAYHGGTK